MQNLAQEMQLKRVKPCLSKALKPGSRGAAQGTELV